VQLEHTFTVPADVEQAWLVLLDIERVAPCLPGAALDSVDGDDFTGTVKVRLGPIGLTYRGKASFVEKDAAAHRAVIRAQGKDARGNGTANATVTATLRGQDGQTEVVVHTDLNITGKPAQFGRGVMVDVGNKLIGQFADCLAGKLTGDVEPSGSPPSVESASVESAPVKPMSAESSASVEPASVERPAHSASPAHAAEVQPIDLLGSAGPALAKRLVPPAVVALVLYLLLRRRR
jgi:carbon monoxide dehydrogenase subunit G